MMIFCDVDFFEDGYCITSLKAFWGQHFHVTGTPPWFLRPLKVFLHCRFFISQLLFHVNNILLFLSCLSLFVIFCHDFGLFYHTSAANFHHHILVTVYFHEVSLGASKLIKKSAEVCHGVQIPTQLFVWISVPRTLM